jgi:LppX_LprAFG lipoprotein
MRLAAAVLLAAVLAGCGSTTGSSLEEAADATAADTSRFEMSYRFAPPPGERAATFGAEGLFDYPNERGVMTVSDEFPPYDEEITLEEFRLVGRTGYTRWTVKGKSYWVKEPAPQTSDDPLERLIPFPGRSTKPTDVLERVLRASEKNEVLGDEDIRGADTTHYRARVSVAKLVEQIPPTDRPGEDTAGWWGRFLPVDIWIDDESRLRRITIRQPEGAEEGNPAMTMTVELYDYGVEVDVEPPAEGTISQEEFDRLTSVGTGWPEEGEGEQISPEEVCQGAREELPEKEADRMCREMKEQG